MMTMATDYRITKNIFNYSSEKEVSISLENCKECVFSDDPTLSVARIKCFHSHPITKMNGNNGDILVEPNGGNQGVWTCSSFATLETSILKLLQHAKQKRFKSVKPSDLPIVNIVSDKEILDIFSNFEELKLIRERPQVAHLQKKKGGEIPDGKAKRS